MEEKQISIFNEIFGSLDNILGDENANGLQVIGAILAMPDEHFEIVKASLQDSIEEVFNSTDAQIAFAQMMNMNGIKIEDFTDNIDDLVTSINDLAAEGVELSESKKDFLKFIFTSFVNSMNLSQRVSRRIISIPIVLCRENAKLPTYATNGSAAMDIYSPEEYTIKPGETVLIPTGIKVDIPTGYAILIQPRSGLSRKTKLRIPNTPGLIDSDYHEEICVIIENIDPPLKEAGIVTLEDDSIQDASLFGSNFTIGKGERFAQMRLIEVPIVNWLQVSSLGDFDKENDHGEGFGSTGTN